MSPTSPMQEAVRALLAGLGEDPGREGLDKTPERVEKALKFLTKGYGEDPKTVINDALFTVDYDEMVIIRDIDVFSLCEHHLLPFYGKAHVAYIPDGRIVGFSKIPRLVDVCARRLQVQERLTSQIADLLMEKLDAKGVAVLLEASHTCMTMRGVRKQGSVMVTSAIRGIFTKDHAARDEVFTHFYHKHEL